MLLILLAIILILAMTALFVSEGLFSSMIMAILSVLCAAFALNAYPALASMALAERQGPIADAAALTALFALSLIVAKELADLLIPKNLQFSLIVDRIGGGVFGLIASMVMIGMVLVIAQMLPMGKAVFGFDPYDNALQRQESAWPFFSDSFAATMGSLGSTGAFGGEGSFNDRHADLLREAAAARNTAGSNSTTFAKPNSMKVTGAYAPSLEKLKAALKIGADDDLPKDPLLDGQAGDVIVVATKIDNECGDTDGSTRLAGTQFRLVARQVEGGELVGGPIDHYPVACFYAKKRDANSWTQAKAPSGSGGAQIGKLVVLADSASIPVMHWVYQLGKGERADYLTFRRVASKKVKKPKPGMPELPSVIKARRDAAIKARKAAATKPAKTPKPKPKPKED